MAPTLAIISAVLLGLYALGVLYAACTPSRQPDPQRGVAVGCLWIVLAGIAAVGLLLGVAVRYGLTLLIYIIAAACIYPAVLLFANLVWQYWNRLRQGEAVEKPPAGAEGGTEDTDEVR